jgi:hypothetical protein
MDSADENNTAIYTGADYTVSIVYEDTNGSITVEIAGDTAAITTEIAGKINTQSGLEFDTADDPTSINYDLK